MKLTALPIIIVALTLASCGSREVEYISCEEYLALDEGDRSDFVENLVLRDEEEEEEKWSHQRTPFPADYSSKLKTAFDQCEKYEPDSVLGIVELSTHIRYGFEPALKGMVRRSQSSTGLSANSSCADFNSASAGSQDAVIDDLIRGTGMRLNRDFSSQASNIKGCVSNALRTPCQSGGPNVRDAMAVCLSTQ